MATSTVEKKANVKDPTKSLFGKKKVSGYVTYKLVEANEKIRPDTPPYKPYIRFPNEDVIDWEGSTRAIRWLPGERSIFVDEQEANGRVVPQKTLDNPNTRFEIINGEIKVANNQTTKIQFLDICNRNVNTNHRAGRQHGIFGRYTEDAGVLTLAEKQEQQKKAFLLSFEADEEQLVWHIDKLGIRKEELNGGASRSDEAIIADYRQYAVDNPEAFLKDFPHKAKAKKEIPAAPVVPAAGTQKDPPPPNNEGTNEENK